MNGSQVPKDHLFISYATEQAALARWLTLKLTAEGYRVWCDQFKLLGGESFPRDIDEAIRSATFRMIALLSKESLKKPNPTKERTLALNLSRERNENLLIPLVTDSTRPVDLNWMLADLTFIPFQASWADGFAELIRNLRASNAPCTLSKGLEVAASNYLVSKTVVERSERIYSNLFQVTRLPAAVAQYSISPPLDEESTISAQENWPIYVANSSRVMAFERPPAGSSIERTAQFESSVSWQDIEKVSNVPTDHIVKILLKRSLYVHCLRRGLKRHPETNEVFFPRGLVQNERLKFRDQHGRANWFLVSGERTKNQNKYRYFLCPVFRVRSDIAKAWYIQLGIRLLLTDEFNAALPKASAIARRKDICSNWWNSEWLKRVLGIAQYLSGGRDTVQIGDIFREQTEISTDPLELSATVGIDEERLSSLKEADAEALRLSFAHESEDVGQHQKNA